MFDYYGVSRRIGGLEIIPRNNLRTSKVSRRIGGLEMCHRQSAR